MKLFKLTLILTLLLISFSLSQSKGGRWQFENNALDSADWDMFDDNGLLVGDASYGQDAPLGEGISYLWLDSTLTNNFLKIEDSEDLDFTDENIAISAWIYPIWLTDAHFFINKGVQNTNPKTTNYSLRISKQKKLEFLIRDSENRAQKVASSFNIPLDQWTFVAVYYDFQSQKVFMWNDPFSEPADTLDFAQSFFANDGPLGIGAWYADDENNPAVAAFKGRIDDVRISGNLADIFPVQTTGLGNLDRNEITSFQLNQNYPNPFNPTTVISYRLLAFSDVELSVYNLTGQKIATLVSEKQSARTYEVQWDATGFASGIYYYQLKANGQKQSAVITKKMVLIK